MFTRLYNLVPCVLPLALKDVKLCLPVAAQALNDAAAAGGAAAEIEHFRLDMPAACGSGGPASEIAEKLLHLLALLKLNLVQRKVRGRL